MKNNCMGCEKRHVGCHGKCEDYKTFKLKQKEVRKNREEYRMKTSVDNRANSCRIMPMMLRGKNTMK